MCSGSCNRDRGLAALNNSSGGWKPKVKALADSEPGENLFSGSQAAVSSPCPHRADRQDQRALWGLPDNTGIPFTRLPPHDRVPPKAPPPDTLTLGLGFSTGVGESQALGLGTLQIEKPGLGQGRRRHVRRGGVKLPWGNWHPSHSLQLCPGCQKRQTRRTCFTGFFPRKRFSRLQGHQSAGI